MRTNRIRDAREHLADGLSFAADALVELDAGSDGGVDAERMRRILLDLLATIQATARAQLDAQIAFDRQHTALERDVERWMARYHSTLRQLDLVRGENAALRAEVDRLRGISARASAAKAVVGPNLVALAGANAPAAE